MVRDGEIPSRSAEAQRFMRENPPNSMMRRGYSQAKSPKHIAELRLEWASEKLKHARYREHLHQKGRGGAS